MKYKTGRMISVCEERTPSQVYCTDTARVKKVLEDAVNSGHYKPEVEFRPYLKGESVLFTFGQVRVATGGGERNEPRFILKPLERTLVSAEALGWE